MPLERETDIHICEIAAYERLKEYGLCDSGIIPDFYGSIKAIDPKLCQPYLDIFLDDKNPPNALLLEYIPSMEMILPQHYTPQRAKNLVYGIRQIHKAAVLHCDVKPRNIMVIKGDPQRIVWLDFDRAQTYDKLKMSRRQMQSILEEELMVSQFAELLVSIICLDIFILLLCYCPFQED